MNVLWLTIGVYIVILITVAIVMGRRSSGIADLTVGGRNAGAWLSALSYGTAYFSAVMFVGYAGGTGLNFGLWGILAGIGNAVFGSWLAWKVLARRTRDVAARLKIKTMPKFFELRFNSKTMKNFTCIIIFIFLVPYSASVYKGLGSIAEVLLGIDDQIFLIIIAVLAAVLMLFGGYLAQARADFIQGIIMMFGVTLLIIFVVRSDKVGGVAGLIEYASTETGLPKLDSSQWISLWATVLMTSFGTWGLPQMVQKYFGISNDKQAKRGAKISTLFAVLVAGGGYFIGSLCHRFYTLNSETVAAMGGQDYIVPNMLKDSQLPEILLGVVLVLLLAASVSTLCSLTLAASSTISLDFFKSNFKKDMSEKKSAILTKAVCLIFIIISYVVANTDTPILDMMSYSWGIISGSLLAPYLLTLYCKFINKIGAWSSILTGFFIALIPAVSKLLTIFGSANETVVFLAGKGPLFACIAMISSIIICIVVSLISGGKNNDDNPFFYKGVIESE